jgi:hypothetical protein
MNQRKARRAGLSGSHHVQMYRGIHVSATAALQDSRPPRLDLAGGSSRLWCRHPPTGKTVPVQVELLLVAADVVDGNFLNVGAIVLLDLALGNPAIVIVWP